MSTPSSQYGYASWFCIMRQTPPLRHCSTNGAVRKISAALAHLIAIAFGGEPMPPRRLSGADVSRKA